MSVKCQLRFSSLMMTHQDQTSRKEGHRSWLVKADGPEPEEEHDGDDQTGSGSGTHCKQEKFVVVGPFRRTMAQAGKPEAYLAAGEPGDDALPSDTTTDDTQTTPKLSNIIPNSYNDQHVPDHQLVTGQPLEAIELIPYKHQVGGHTTLWRFSKRAVCKQLNNRENVFYETVERYHRDLLVFLPRYIGVVNVTFQRQPRLKSISKKDGPPKIIQPPKSDDATLETSKSHLPSQPGGNENVAYVSSSVAERDDTAVPRMISKSVSVHVPIPTVTFEDNRHILPRNLLRPNSSLFIANRVRSASESAFEQVYKKQEVDPIPRRPPLEERPNSWGATTINKRLRNEVFNEMFLDPTSSLSKSRRGQSRSLLRRSAVHSLQTSTSDAALIDRHHADGPAEGGRRGSTPAIYKSRTVGPDFSDGAEADNSGDEENWNVKDLSGTSAPESETFSGHMSDHARKLRAPSRMRRRHRSMDSRAEGKRFEQVDDAGYGGDHEDASQPESNTNTPHQGEPSDPMIKTAPPRPNNSPPRSPPQSASIVPTEPDATTYEQPAEVYEFNVPRPINPKEAQQMHSDSRVEYFLLLEDLTAGMTRPCIMDLKMGTRQYGVEASPSKQRSQQRKCSLTTSRELGVRVCGLQVWDVAAQKYEFRDKYYGRKIKAGREFQDALTRFLYDGRDYHSVLRHIPAILQKLARLEEIVGRLRGYRFYAASLLMFYDGDASEEGDDEYDTMVDDSKTDFATDTEEISAVSAGIREARQRRQSHKNKREIDFKIADFANSLTEDDFASDKPCPPQHPNEPDRGFLQGLKSLRRYFLKIQRDARLEVGLDPMGRRGSNTSDEWADELGEQLMMTTVEDDGLVSE